MSLLKLEQTEFRNSTPQDIFDVTSTLDIKWPVPIAKSRKNYSNLQDYIFVSEKQWNTQKQTLNITKYVSATHVFADAMFPDEKENFLKKIPQPSQKKEKILQSNSVFQQ